MAKRYVVIGPRRVCETDPGHEFERDLTEAEERRLVGVHILCVEPAAQPKPRKKSARKRRRAVPKPQPQSEE